MKISVTDAQALIEALRKGVDDAMSKGAHELDLVSVAQSIDDKARDDLQKAIEAARNG